MFLEERLQYIRKTLKKDGRVTVKKLAIECSVTEDCIRKDLKTLENQGELKRTYGGAILSREYPLERNVVDRKTYHLEEKQLIAKKALRLVKEGETIFLDISSTNIQLALLLAKENIHITVVTNMIDIIEILMQNSMIKVIGTGGCVYPKTNGFLGAEAIEAIRKYSYDRAFIGTCGIEIKSRMMTTLGGEDGITKKNAIECSRHVYALMDREKFYFNESYKFASVEAFNGIITDCLPDENMLKLLNECDVSVF